MFILLAAQNTNWLFYHPKIPLGVRNLSFLRNLSVFKKPSKIKGTNVITITNLIADVYQRKLKEMCYFTPKSETHRHTGQIPCDSAKRRSSPIPAGQGQGHLLAQKGFTALNPHNADFSRVYPTVTGKLQFPVLLPTASQS